MRSNCQGPSSSAIRERPLEVHIECEDNPRESGEVAVCSPAVRTAIGPHAANRVIAVGLCDLEGSSRTSAGACKDAQTMQRGCSTGAKEVASRVFQCGMNGCEHGFLVITLWPTFGAVQSIVLHLYPLLKVFVCPV
jgi:hypothetical protein